MLGPLWRSSDKEEEHVSLIYPSNIPKFAGYFRPKTVAEAIQVLAEYGREARVLAGGTDVVVLMRARVMTPKYMVDITDLSELKYVARADDGSLRIGALATLRAVENSPLVRLGYPGLYEAIRQMGSPQVRSLGTVAGNICRASPAADSAGPLLVLDARVQVQGPSGSRTLALEEFFTGPAKTSLGEAELVTEIQVPKLPDNCGTAFLRLTRSNSDLAKLSASAAMVVQKGICADVKIALGAVAPVPLRAHQAEAALKGKPLNEETIGAAAEIAAGEAKPITDQRSTREYRKEVLAVVVQRVLRTCAERALR